MAEKKPFPGPHLRKEDFEKFEGDLALLLSAFRPELLGKWMGKDAGNFSKKVNGVQGITSNFLRDFYSKLGSVIAKLQKGVAAYQIEMEMSSVEDPLEHKNLWEEFRLLKEKVNEHEVAIEELKAEREKGRADGGTGAADGPDDESRAQNP